MKTPSDRKRFAKELESIQLALGHLGDRIDELGYLGDRITHSAEPDMLACFASNTMQGALSLLREMGRLVDDSRKKRKGIDHMIANDRRKQKATP